MTRACWRWLWHRHDWTLQITRTRIRLYCPHCDTATPGWDVTPREEDDDGRPEQDNARRRPTTRPADRC